ncbi:FAD-dependent oxidoreductase [Pseudoalteromonas sp. Of7M-16]|nr:FAD-dependent oxidoreductase [Pseudoalteromonas sp. Of7M-16]
MLGLFAVGAGSTPYVDLQEDEIIKYILNELDELFDGKASTYYVKHITQNWNTEAHIYGAYVSNNEDWEKIKKLGESIDERLFLLVMHTLMAKIGGRFMPLCIQQNAPLKIYSNHNVKS